MRRRWVERSEIHQFDTPHLMGFAALNPSYDHLEFHSVIPVRFVLEKWLAALAAIQRVPANWTSEPKALHVRIETRLEASHFRQYRP
jgi:hypothetical protein